MIRSPSLRSTVATFWPLTLVPLVLSMSVRRHCGGLTSIMKWTREMLLSLTASRKLALGPANDEIGAFFELEDLAFVRACSHREIDAHDL